MKVDIVPGFFQSCIRMYCALISDDFFQLHLHGSN